MKRFTSLMLTLLFAVTTFAQTLPATDKSFTITTASRGGLAANDAAAACVGFNHTDVSSEEQKNFAFVQYDGNVYLYNVWAKKFMQKDGTLTTTLPIDNIQVTNLDGGAYFFKYDDTHVVNLGGSSQLTIDGWSTVDAGNTYTLTEVGTFDPAEAIAVLENSYTITYDFQYNGETIGTQTATVEKGAAYPAIDTTIFPFGFTATTPTGTVDADTEMTIELTATFSWADSYENITAWYYLDLKDGKYLFYEEGQTNIPLTQGAVDSNNRDAYSWGFIGDPVNGFQIVNLAAGNAMILSSTTDTSDGNTGGSTYPVMTAMPVPEGNNTHWVFTASTYRTDGFYIGQKDNASNRLNNRDSKLAYWTGGADAGSTFLMTERDMTGAAELQELVDGVDAVSENYQGAIGTAVGNLTEESVTAVASALAAAKSILALDDRTTDQITSAHVTLQEAIDALATVQPTEGKFYTIASASEQNEDSRTGKMIYVNADGGMKFDVADNTNLGYLFQFEAAGDGKFYMYNVAKDRYLSTAKAHGSGQEQSLAEETTGAKKVTIKNLGLENVVGLWPEGGAMIHAQTANSVVVAWNNEENNNGSAWRIVEVEDPTTTSFDLTIGEAGYATLYLGCAVTIPEGVEAYAVSEVDEWAVLSPVTGAIPANEAVILKKAEGQPTDDTTYKFNYAESATAVETNLLGGTTVDTYIAGPAYVLGNVDGVGLYKAVLNADATGAATGELTHFKNNAHKACLLATDGALTAASYSFRFGEGTTGIENVVTENGAKAIFDLTGRRVEAISAPGIYIVNGKKVLVK